MVLWPVVETDSGWTPPGLAQVHRLTEHQTVPALNALVRETSLDVAIVIGNPPLASDWLSALATAAHTDDTVAAATAIATKEESPPGAACPRGRQSEGSSRPASSELVYPRTLDVSAGCMLIRREAIELLGPFAEWLHHPYAVLTEFLARAMATGGSCVVSEKVVLPGVLREELPPEEAKRLQSAHPWLTAALEEDSQLDPGPLRRARLHATRGSRAASVTIDARSLGPGASGTQTYVGGLATALAASGEVTVSAVVRDVLPLPERRELEAYGVHVLTESEAASRACRSDLAHRPQQVFVPEDLHLLRLLGERIVVTHLDLISYRNPTYHASTDEWRRYRRVTRLALAASDGVVFLSRHARDDALAEELVPPGRTSITGLGITSAQHPPSRRPVGIPPGREFVVMIGADYRHKNRLFALEVVDRLRLDHGWKGILVLAGSHVPHGGSAESERAIFAGRPELAQHVIDLGAVDEAEKWWLLQHAQALLHPSIYEGFGITPLEAATAGIPCLFSATTASVETVGASAATIVPWDAAASAERAIELLRPGRDRESHVSLLRDALQRYTWPAIASAHICAYERALASPYRSAAPRAWAELDRERQLAQLDARYRDLSERVAHGLPLIDRGGFLTIAEQRGLMRVASRRWLHRPLLGPLGLLGRLQIEPEQPGE